MTESQIFQILLYSWFGMSAGVFILLFFLTAPYGRHTRKGWGPSLPSTWGWVLMELPAVAVPLTCYFLSDRMNNPVLWCFLGMWLFHYTHRTFVYPFRMRMQGKRMFLAIMLSGAVTNVGINYLNARWLFTLGPEYTTAWFTDIRFILGVALFALGFFINFQSDEILRNLRKPGETGYKIPKGGAYRWVSSPNYFGEILEWLGFALATWSLPALAFALWTMSNLSPRARSNHQWYQDTFPEYPKERKALIPFVW